VFAAISLPLLPVHALSYAGQDAPHSFAGSQRKLHCDYKELFAVMVEHALAPSNTVQDILASMTDLPRRHSLHKLQVEQARHSFVC
jgi:hypothetical protein